MRLRSRTGVAAMLLGASLAMFASGPLTDNAVAQDSMQTGDGLLRLTATMPPQTRVGESFEYTVQVTNASDNVVLHNIELNQSKSSGFTIESVSMQGQKQNQQDQQATSEQSDGSGKRMTIKMLEPGQSQTLTVRAAADEEGELKSCLEIVNYTPALCLTSQVVKPQLELTKVAPERANRCNVILLEYTVKNGGTGDVGPFRITDSLGSDIATIEGSSELSFPVDGLAAGDSRKFVARVYAKKPGTYSSRAMAKAENSDLKSRSKKTTTNVIAADLAVSVDGPQRIYGNQLTRFTARITNTGNAPAEDVRVQLMWPQAANLVDLGTPTMEQTQSSGSDQLAAMRQGQPTPATSEDTSDDSQSEQDRPMPMSEDTLIIDRLEPGQTAAFDYAIRAGDLEELPTKVVATHVCTVEPADDQAQAQAKATSMAMARVKVVRLPALQLMVIDDEDPVKAGTDVVYTIRVWNEGDAPDSNVRLVAKLPEGLEFVSAQGPTQHSDDGSTITFDPLKTLAAGDRIDYQVVAKGNANKVVRFEVELTSKQLPAKVTAEEPTRLFAN